MSGLGGIVSWRNRKPRKKRYSEFIARISTFWLPFNTIKFCEEQISSMWRRVYVFQRELLMHSEDECNHLPHKCVGFRVEDEENNVVLV